MYWNKQTHRRPTHKPFSKVHLLGFDYPRNFGPDCLTEHSIPSGVTFVIPLSHSCEHFTDIPTRGVIGKDTVTRFSSPRAGSPFLTGGHATGTASAGRS